MEPDGGALMAPRTNGGAGLQHRGNAAHPRRRHV
jgi:hypothetical protein